MKAQNVSLERDSGISKGAMLDLVKDKENNAKSYDNLENSYNSLKKNFD